MAEERTPREQEERTAETRPSDDWIPQSLLPVPNPVPGWTFRWIRTMALGKADNANVSKRFREGWIPVKAEDHPEIAAMSDLDSRFEGNIEMGGSLLCKIADETVEARNRYYHGKAIQQMESVDNNLMRENDPRMPLLKPERKTRTTFGSG